MTAAETAAFTAAPAAARLTPPFLALGPAMGASGAFTGTAAAGGRPVSPLPGLPLVCLTVVNSAGSKPSLACSLAPSAAASANRVAGA